jgi:hypothetical protein
MSLGEHIRQLAAEIANNAQQRVSELERQLEEVEKRKAQIEAERDTARFSMQRLATFPVKLSGDYLCPRCWIESGARSPLFLVPSEGRNDLMRCRLCHSEIAFPD